MTPITTPDVLRRMPPLTVSNHLIGDGEALFEAIARDGYVYLQGVLDLEALGRLKRAYMDVLVDMGMIDPAAAEPIWNGKDLTGFPIKIEPLHEAKVWETFVAEPAIEAIFTRLLGSRPFWIPIVEYRITPPSHEAWEDPFIQRHQDGFYNQGITFTTCWVPLMEIGEAEGGLAVAEGMNHTGILHDVNDPPQYSIPRGAIPDTAWRRGRYRPGDLVMFNTQLPHTGLPNHSDRFRLSMDVRVTPSHGELPVLGDILEILPNRLLIRNHDGETVSIRIDSETYCRWTNGRRRPLDEMLTLMRVGEPIMASVKDGHAVVLRPPR